MALEKIKLTHDALQELQDELDHLKSVGRREMSEKIKVALSFGDLSENSEAKSEQGKMESRIQELEATIQNAEIIDESELSADTVNRSSKVTIHDLDMDEDETFVIVGFTQADPLNGKLSDESPIGKAILGKREGDVVEVELPNNKKTSVRIVKIEQKN